MLTTIALISNTPPVLSVPDIFYQEKAGITLESYPSNDGKVFLLKLIVRLKMEDPIQGYVLECARQEALFRVEGEPPVEPEEFYGAYQFVVHGLNQFLHYEPRWQKIPEECRTCPPLSACIPALTAIAQYYNSH